MDNQVATDKKAAIARAAKNVVTDTSTEIYEVIDSDEDNDVKLTDRLVASLATFFVTGAGYAMAWFLIAAAISHGGGFMYGSIVRYWFDGWHVVAALTLITALAAFIRPNWTARIFGYFMKPVDALF